jgi:hypothetical protein
MRAARCKYMCDYTRKRRSKANLPPSPEEEEEANTTTPPPGPAPSPSEQNEEVMEAGDILKTLASSYETRSCRCHPPAATTAVVHGAGAAPPHILEGPARPPILKNVGPRRRSAEWIHVRTTVEADDGQNRMQGRRVKSHLEGGGGNRREAGRGGRLPDTKAQPRMVFSKMGKKYNLQSFRLDGE